MRYQTYGFTISFLVHAAGVFLLITFCQFVPVEKKNFLIDFSTLSVTRPVPVPAKEAIPGRPKNVSPPVPGKKIVKEKPPVPAIPARPKNVSPPVPGKKIAKEKLPVPAIPARPKNVPPPVPGKKIVKEKPPVPVAKTKPAEKKTKAIQPRSELKAMDLPPEPEPTVVAEIAEPAPDPTPNRMVNSAENLSAQVANGPIVTDGPTDTAARQSSMVKKKFIKAHFLYIKEDIEKNITYPRLARKMGWEGTVLVSFVICEDGTVTKIKIVRSSGFALLDKNAVASIKKAVPFPNPPVRAELVVPISYRLS